MASAPIWGRSTRQAFGFVAPDHGATWANGFLPGTTTFATPPGSFSAISDASVAFDAAHNTWLILSLGINGNETLVVSRSTDNGHTWSQPVTVATGALDKNWIVCDNTSMSSFFGHCYAEWDRTNSSDLLQMSTSSDGGQTWGAPKATAASNHGLGGQPLVQPNGTVVVPYESTASNRAVYISFEPGSTLDAEKCVHQTEKNEEGIGKDDARESTDFACCGCAGVIGT